MSQIFLLLYINPFYVRKQFKEFQFLMSNNDKEFCSLPSFQTPKMEKEIPLKLPRRFCYTQNRTCILTIDIPIQHI